MHPRVGSGPVAITAATSPTVRPPTLPLSPAAVAVAVTTKATVGAARTLMPAGACWHYPLAAAVWPHEGARSSFQETTRAALRPCLICALAGPAAGMIRAPACCHGATGARLKPVPRRVPLCMNAFCACKYAHCDWRCMLRKPGACVSCEPEAPIHHHSQMLLSACAHAGRCLSPPCVPSQGMCVCTSDKSPACDIVGCTAWSSRKKALLKRCILLERAAHIEESPRSPLIKQGFLYCRDGVAPEADRSQHVQARQVMTDSKT